MYVKYAVGAFTVGVHQSEADHDTASSSRVQSLMVLLMQ